VRASANDFRELLKKVGSGTHTGKDLSRAESAAATKMMLQQIATPAQIGAFAIAHRIKRPTPEELAGMLDAYDELGPQISIEERLPVVMGNPYDGRSRTVPVTPITGLILAAANIPVVMHGGDCMPTKYGIPIVRLWQHLGVDFSQVSLSEISTLLKTVGIASIYLPLHFPLAQDLVPYREQIGKRPPFATVELIWSPIAGNSPLVAGFVHPPTEERFINTFKLRGVTNFTTVKGLEGSCDLATSRTAIIGIGKPGRELERLLLHPIDYGLAAKDVALESIEGAISQIRAVLEGKNSELMSAAILNGGFYLWRFGACTDLSTAFALAKKMLIEGKALAKLQELQKIEFKNLTR
jgi:anthranilate phosphoribosyltransferase